MELQQCDPRGLGSLLGLGVEVVVQGKDSNVEGLELARGFDAATFVDKNLLGLSDAF